MKKGLNGRNTCNKFRLFWPEYPSPRHREVFFPKTTMYYVCLYLGGSEVIAGGYSDRQCGDAAPSEIWIYTSTCTQTKGRYQNKRHVSTSHCKRNCINNFELFMMNANKEALEKFDESVPMISCDVINNTRLFTTDRYGT